MENETNKSRIDWVITILPLSIILILCSLFFVWPSESNSILSQIRFFFGDTLGVYYLMIGLGVFTVSLYIAFSRYGNIVLGGKTEKPKYSFFTWGTMMFTAGLAADILFYSFSEWLLYTTDPYLAEIGNPFKWAGVFPIFHWSLIPWGFYLVLACAFGFMIHVRKRGRQKYSEACRALLGRKTDGWVGQLIDLLAVFALLAGTATTFSVATPLMSQLIVYTFNIQLNITVITIVILIVTCIIYTYALLHGFKGIGVLAKICVYLFFGILGYIFIFGGETKFIIENGLTSLGLMIQNFISLSTYTDPMRTTSFPQNWTIYYWAYWMVWCVAAPFFIGKISRGRTIKQTIIGGYIFGVGSTIISFIILGNYSLGTQIHGLDDFISIYTESNDIYATIVEIIKSTPLSSIVIVLVLVNMITFYCTSFDSIALTAAMYSYRGLEEDEMPDKSIQLLWCILLILLPIALTFSDSSMSNLQTVSIIAAFPIGVIMIMIVTSFIKDANSYLKGM